MTINRSTTLILLILSSLFLSACSSVISISRDKPIGENYGKRTTGAFFDDQLIETKAKVNLSKIDERFKPAQVTVNSFNGVVLITGNVSDSDMRAIATETVSKIRKVRRVNNELNVSPPRYIYTFLFVCFFICFYVSASGIVSMVRIQESFPGFVYRNRFQGSIRRNYTRAR